MSPAARGGFVATTCPPIEGIVLQALRANWALLLGISLGAQTEVSFRRTYFPAATLFRSPAWHVERSKHRARPQAAPRQMLSSRRACQLNDSPRPELTRWFRHLACVQTRGASVWISTAERPKGGTDAYRLSNHGSGFRAHLRRGRRVRRAARTRVGNVGGRRLDRRGSTGRPEPRSRCRSHRQHRGVSDAADVTPRTVGR